MVTPSMASAMARTGEGIMSKWRESTAANGGFFLRHRDGDFSNKDPSNIVPIHPFDSLSAVLHGKNHADDWCVGLTDDEVAFVKEYAYNFCVTYQAHGRTPAEPPLPRGEDPPPEVKQQLEAAMAAAMSDPEVARLVAEGDRAMG